MITTILTGASSRAEMNHSRIRGEYCVEKFFRLRIGTEVDCSRWGYTNQIGAQAAEERFRSFVLHNMSKTKKNSVNGEAGTTRNVRLFRELFRRSRLTFQQFTACCCCSFLCQQPTQILFVPFSTQC